MVISLSRSPVALTPNLKGKCDHFLPRVIIVFLFWLPLILSLGSITSRTENYRKSGSVFLFEKSFHVSLLFFFFKLFFPFFLSYILYAWNVQILSEQLEEFLLTYISTCSHYWDQNRNSSMILGFPRPLPSQYFLPAGSHHCDSYELLGGVFGILWAFSPDSWWRKLIYIVHLAHGKSESVGIVRTPSSFVLSLSIPLLLLFVGQAFPLDWRSLKFKCLGIGAM